MNKSFRFLKALWVFRKKGSDPCSRQLAKYVEGLRDDVKNCTTASCAERAKMKISGRCECGRMQWQRNAEAN